jgi:hypothetical protein
MDELLEECGEDRCENRHSKYLALISYELLPTQLRATHLIINLLAIKQECSADVGIQKAEPQRIAAIETMQASTLSSDDNPSPLAKTQQRKYHFGSRSPSGQSPVTKSRKAPQNLLVTSSPLLNPSCSDKETNSPKQKSTWKHFVTNQFKKMQPQNESPTSNVNEGCTLSQCTPVSLSSTLMIDCFTTILFTYIFH